MAVRHNSQTSRTISKRRWHRRRRRRRYAADPSVLLLLAAAAAAAVTTLGTIAAPCMCLTTAVGGVEAFTAPHRGRQYRLHQEQHRTDTTVTSHPRRQYAGHYPSELYLDSSTTTAAAATSPTAVNTTTDDSDVDNGHGVEQNDDDDFNINKIRAAARRRTIHLPFTLLETGPGSLSSMEEEHPHDKTTTQSVLSAFDDVVDYYSTFLICMTDKNDRSSDSTRSCSIPVFGENARLVLAKATNEKASTSDAGDSSHRGFTMYMDGIDSDEDYEFLCNKLWDVRLYVDSWKHYSMDITPLRTVVADAMNQKQDGAPIGYDASSADWAGSSEVSDLFELHNADALDELFDKGFTVIDTPWTTSHKSHDKMSKYLTEITDQGDHVRRDKVHFLTSDHADTCGLMDQYQLLMGVAHYLNVNYAETTTTTTTDRDDDDCGDIERNDDDTIYTKPRPERMIYTDTISSRLIRGGGRHPKRRSFRNSPHQPISPGTSDRPLSIPSDIQLAEYGLNDFYVAHSDNSLQKQSSDSTPSPSSSSSSWITETERRNHRHLTCILYMNDDWNKHEDGGALRIYPGSRDVMEPRQVLGNDADTDMKTETTTRATIPNTSAVVGGGNKTNNSSRRRRRKCSNPSAWDHVDISPQNGRMILFDSCLIHSVQAVTSEEKVRRALTIWIYRPEDSGVKGEKFY